MHIWVVHKTLMFLLAQHDHHDCPLSFKYNPPFTYSQLLLWHRGNFRPPQKLYSTLRLTHSTGMHSSVFFLSPETAPTGETHPPRASQVNDHACTVQCCISTGAASETKASITPARRSKRAFPFPLWARLLWKLNCRWTLGYAFLFNAEGNSCTHVWLMYSEQWPKVEKAHYLFCPV